MKRTIFLTAAALLISAGLMAQNTGQTQNQNGTQTQTQMQTGTQTQTQTGTQLQNQIQTRNQDGTQSRIRVREQVRVDEGTATGDQIRKRDQVRLQDPDHALSGTGSQQKAQMRAKSASQVRRVQINDGARNSAMQRNMKMSNMAGGKRR